ncbi:hypothetical protein PVK06_012954 [Gossypium arboreum]|uniref:Protein kinase domain-containing protein n=1 Tax=Gossypium arboreum TaxID=29729 RepID=A0ABR0QCT9_GOSAR|nr:hypothetical protein PVK06_012954 [Gossypium arboreum]
MSSFNVNGLVRFPTFLASEIVWQIAWLNRVCILPMDCCYLIKCRLSVSHLVRADTEGAAFPQNQNGVDQVFTNLLFDRLSFVPSLWRKRQKAIKLDNDDDDKLFGGDFQNGMGPNKFPFTEIAKMTSNFKGEKLGGGGFGAVYRGYVRDLDTLVAVQQIAKASKQGIKEYTSEVKIISRLRHKNLVKLIGWCHKKGELVLVYEFMANGGLDSHLFKGKTLLTLVTIAYYIGISKLATLCGMLVDDWAVVRPSGPELKTVDKASNSGS